MECEPMTVDDDGAPPSRFRSFDEADRSGAGRRRVIVRLRDILPCNLRSGNNFLRSSVRLAVNKWYLRSFVRCYGYLMYNRAEKIALLDALPLNEDARIVASWLSEATDIDSFRAELHNHLSQTRTLLSDDMLSVLDLDDDINNAFRKAATNNNDDGDDSRHASSERSEGRGTTAATEGDDDDEAAPKLPKLSGRQFLAFTRKSLDEVLSFLSTTENLRTSLNVNEFTRRLCEVDSSLALEHVKSVWREANETLDADGLLSIVTKDAIVSTGLETYGALPLLVRVSLLFTFFVTQTLNAEKEEIVVTNDDGSIEDDEYANEPLNVVTVRLAENDARAENDCGTIDAIREYFNESDVVTMDKLLGTIFGQIVRSSFVSFVEWPCRLLENNGRTIDLRAIHEAIANGMRAGASSHHGGSESRWLRAIFQRGNNVVGDASANGARIYANASCPIDLFERMSAGIKNEDLRAAGQNIATLTTYDPSVARKMPIRVYSTDLQKRHNDFQSVMRLCERSITDHLRAKQSGLSPRDFARTSPDYVPARSAPAGGCDDDDDEEKEKKRRDDDDAFVAELGRSLVYGVIALIRHDVVPYDRRFDSINYSTATSADAEDRRAKRLLRYDENIDSYSVLLQDIYAYIYRVKANVGQIRNFLGRMVDMWNEQIGILSFDRMGPFMLAMYHLFPEFQQ